jgi:hypothetical protein
MSQSPGAPGAPALVLRLSVPAGDSFQSVAKELAAKVAAYLGITGPEARVVAAMLDRLASHVVPTDHADLDRDVTFEFRQADRELLIEARCAGRTSEGRHRLPV